MCFKEAPMSVYRTVWRGTRHGKCFLIENGNSVLGRKTSSPRSYYPLEGDGNVGQNMKKKRKMRRSDFKIFDVFFTIPWQLLGLEEGYQPTKFKYLMKSKPSRVSLGTNESYPYDWFLDGEDSCLGDSGGPLWRNIERDGEVRATQIGVVSRGMGCASFNVPVISGSVKKSYSWISGIVRKHKSNDDICI